MISLGTSIIYQNLSNIVLLLLIAMVGMKVLKHHKVKLIDYFASLLIGLSISETLKFFINSPRPALGGLSVEGSSFPSTHSTVAFTAAFFYILFCHNLSLKKGRVVSNFGEHLVIIAGSLYKDKMVVIVTLLASLVALLRVISKVHYFSDIFAGIIIGLIVSIPFVFYDVTLRPAQGGTFSNIRKFTSIRRAK